MVAFAASCIGLLLFLWISFGGSTSLSPQGYGSAPSSTRPRTSAARPTSRISGVNVGKVISVGLDRRTGLTRGGDADRSAVRAAAGGHARDPAPEDAARRDVRRALARARRPGPSCATARRCRAARSRRRCSSTRSSRRSTPRPAQAFETWMQQDGDRAHRPRPGPQRRARRAVPVRDQRRFGAGGAAPRQRGHEHAAGRRRPGARRGDALAGGAPATGQQRQHRCSPRPPRRRRGARGHDQGVPAVPDRDADDDRPGRAVRRARPSRWSTSSAPRRCS